ncbi:MAG: radical SAM protein, partial [Candidatus Avispirillum sp.]
MDPSEVKYEAPLTKHLFRKAVSRGVPLSGTIEVSPVCNFNCRMCYVRKSPQEVAAGERRMLEVGDWLRIAAQARDAGALYMLITGGEPFLWPGFRTLYEELVRLGFLVTVNTNGSLIDKDTVEWLKKLPPVRLNITLYGASDETYGRLC